MAELQTWLDLPEHPNLTACRFLRTIGDEVAIFAEFVEGGSLVSWIKQRRSMKLEQILDVAIQSAWALHMIHELGLVHQDVKPGNMLMTPEGVVKLTDFGTARGMAHTPLRAATLSGSRSMIVSAVGMTPAYRSPEQKRGDKLDRRTDVWSWGVSVLEMFYGEPPCPYGGETAAEVLETYLSSSNEHDGDLPAMRPAVAEVLRNCFKVDPRERWSNLAEAAESLQVAYQEALGKAYPRALAPIPKSQDRTGIVHDRRTTKGGQWADPLPLLEKALGAAGQDPAQAKHLIPPRRGSRRAQAIADLAAYEEICRICRRLVDAGRTELAATLAFIYVNKALVHGNLADGPGVLACYDRAIEIYDRLVNREGHRELANDLARAYMDKANTVADLRDLRSAVGLYDRAIEIHDRLVNQEGHRELANDLAMAYMNKAVAVMQFGDLRSAVGLYDRAIEIHDRLVNQEGRRELANNLAMAYMNKANAVADLGDLSSAVGLYDRAIEIYDRLVNQEGRRELANDLARAYMNKAVAVRRLGDLRSAVGLCDRAIEIHDRLVNQEGHRELANDLARAYVNKANAVRQLGDLRSAVGLYDRAIEIHDRLVNQEGHRELANDLARTYMNKANAVRQLGDLRSAVGLYDRAIEIRDRLVNQEGHRELLGDWARGIAGRADTLKKLGETARARTDARQVVLALEVEVARSGRSDLHRLLNWAKSSFADLL